MPKTVIVADLQRPSVGMPWGFVVQGGKDQGLTFKIGNVKKMTPASRAGLCKMDYLISVNGRPVFNMDHMDVVREIKGSGQQLRIECERGDHIVPSFEELFPGLGKDEDIDGTGRKAIIGKNYYEDAMENHGLGHMPQPDNFTTVGNNLGIEINQYNCPIDAYSQNTIEEMRDQKEKGGLDNVALLEKAHEAKGPGPKFDPRKSNAIEVIALEEKGLSIKGGRSA